jgi:hypothetical protein
MTRHGRCALRKASDIAWRHAERGTILGEPALVLPVKEVRTARLNSALG